MRPLLFLCCGFLSIGSALLASGPTLDGKARPATAEELHVLNDLVQRTATELRRWAYTEHRVIRDEKGRVKSEQLVRHDPSLPYEEQWRPLKIDGREPTERELARFRKRGEQSDPERPQRRFSFGGTDRRRIALGEAIDLYRASVAAESETHWVFEVPLRKAGNDRFPPEKFQVHARVRKDGTVLETIAVTLRESFRSKLVLKVKSGEATLTFAQVDPKHPATLVSVTGDASASVMFVSVGGAVELNRSEQKRVKPYDERFEVQIGTLKAIDF